MTCKRFYADDKPKEEVYVDPYLPPDPEELDARFSDIPDWKVPPVNPQTLTPYPEVPYDDPQNRRYYGEPVSSHFLLPPQNPPPNVTYIIAFAWTSFG